MANSDFATLTVSETVHGTNAGCTAGATAPSVVGRTATTREPRTSLGAEAATARGEAAAPHAICGGQPFRQILRDLGLTSNQVWGLTKTDQEWAERLEAALMATRRDDLQHGTNAAYGMRLQRVPNTPAHPYGQEPQLTVSRPARICWQAPWPGQLARRCTLRHP